MPKNSQQKNKQRDIVFPEGVVDLMGRVLKKYKLEESDEEIFEKMEKGEKSAEVLLPKLTKEIAQNLISADEASLTIQQELELTVQTAKKISEEIAGIAALATLAEKPNEINKRKSLDKWTTTEQNKLTTKRQDPYREAAE